MAVVVNMGLDSVDTNISINMGHTLGRWECQPKNGSVDGRTNSASGKTTGRKTSIGKICGDKGEFKIDVYDTLEAIQTEVPEDLYERVKNQINGNEIETLDI